MSERRGGGNSHVLIMSDCTDRSDDRRTTPRPGPQLLCCQVGSAGCFVPQVNRQTNSGEPGRVIELPSSTDKPQRFASHMISHASPQDQHVRRRLRMQKRYIAKEKKVSTIGTPSRTNAYYHQAANGGRGGSRAVVSGS